jgi:hypothetical protein
MKRIAKAVRLAHPIAAALVVALVFVQVYLIAEYIFGDAGALDAHMTTGRVVVGLELVVLLTAPIGRGRDRTDVGLSAALVVVGGLQASLAKDIGSSPQVHALHGLLALVVVVVAWLIAARGRREFFPRPAAARS